MPAIAVSVAPSPEGLVAIIDATAMAPAAGSADDAGNGGFQALLNVAGQPDISSGSPATISPPQESAAPKSAPASADKKASAATVATASVQTAPPAKNNNANNTSNAADNNTADKNTTGNTEQTKNISASNEGSASQQETSQSSSNSSLQPSSVQNTSAGQDGGQPVAPSADKLRDELRQQLGTISQILMSILQAMSGVAVPTAVVPTVAAPVIMPQPDASGSQIAGSNQPALSPADAISLLKDMQSLIDQLQQALQLDGQAADAQNTAGPLTSAVMPTPGTTQSQGQMQESAANAGATFQQLIDALQTDNAALAQMLKPQSTGNAVLDLTQMLKPQNAGSVISGTSVPSPLTASSDSAPVNQALLNSIAQVKGQLQQLQAANDAFFQQAQSDFHAQFAQALSSLSQASSTSGQDSGIAAASAAALPDNRNGAVAAAAQPVSQTVINLAGAMAVAPAATSQGNTGGGTGDNGSGQSQPAPLPVTASSQPASSQPAPAGNVAMVSFARVLNQASAPASLLDQVTFNVKTASTDGSSKIHIQLEPADLGKLDIQLNVGTDGKTGVIITADNKNTLALLQRDTAGLMRALSDAGLSTSSGNLSFSLGGGQQQQFAGGQQPASHAAANYQSAQPEDDLSIPMVSQTYAVSLTQGLDITI